MRFARLKAALHLMVAQGVGLVLAFAAQVVLARLLGVSNLGIYAFTLAVLNVAILFAKFGVDQFMLRESRHLIELGDIDSYKKLRAKCRNIIITVGLIVATFLAVWLFVWQRSDLELGLFSLLCLAFSIVLGALTAMNSQALMSMGYPVRAYAPDAIVRPSLLIVGLIVIGLYRGIGVGEALLVYVLAIVLSFISATTFQHFALKSRTQDALPGTDANDYTLRDILSVATPFLLVSGTFLVASQLDVLVLGVVSTPDQTGAYSVAARLAMLAQIGLIAAQSTSAGQIRQASLRGDMNAVQDTVNFVAKAAAAIGGTTALMIYIFIDDLLLVFGSDFSFAASATKVLLIYQLANCLTGPTGIVLNMLGLERLCAKSLMYALLANLVVSVPLAMHYGAIGAAVATTSIMVIWNIVMSAEIYRRLGVKVWLPVIRKGGLI